MTSGESVVNHALTDEVSESDPCSIPTSISFDYTKSASAGNALLIRAKSLLLCGRFWFEDNAF